MTMMKVVRPVSHLLMIVINMTKRQIQVTEFQAMSLQHCNIGKSNAIQYSAGLALTISLIMVVEDNIDTG